MDGLPRPALDEIVDRREHDGGFSVGLDPEIDEIRALGPIGVGRTFLKPDEGRAVVGFLIECEKFLRARFFFDCCC